jgi:DNA-binding CsgD family transcriptional regulator/PAS domain-containing protein
MHDRLAFTGRCENRSDEALKNCRKGPLDGSREFQEWPPKSFGAGRGEVTAASFELTLRSLASRFDNFTFGVAVYERGLHCRALNAVLAKLSGAPVSAHLGKTIRESFGNEARNLEPAFERVWATGNSVSNFPWTVRFPARRESGPWIVNFYPIGDELGKVQLVAATFSEVPKRRSVEMQLCRLTDKLQTSNSGTGHRFGGEFTDLSTRTLELVQRSVDLLKSSLTLRCYVSEMRIEIALVSSALGLAGAREPMPVSLPTAMSGAHPAASTSPGESAAEFEPPAGCPSPRERQVLHLLADGKSNKEIGSALEISTRTVESYRARMMLKLDLHSTAALVRYAIRMHIVEA